MKKRKELMELRSGKQYKSMDAKDTQALGARGGLQGPGPGGGLSHGGVQAAHCVQARATARPSRR